MGVQVSPSRLFEGVFERSNRLVVRFVATSGYHSFGVCHSDLHFMQGSIAGPTPTVPGHEPAGIVKAVGAHVSSVAVGDHVIACTSMFCGSCKRCMFGRTHLCTDRRYCMRPKGANPRLSLDGEPLTQFADLSGFSEMMLLHERAVVKIDDDTPLDRAALAGCAVTTGVGAALNTAKFEPGSSVAVFGCGGVGASVIQGARLAGARQIIAIDLLPSKLEVGEVTRTVITFNQPAQDRRPAPMHEAPTRGPD